jgi:hypothetical protein
MITRGTPMPHKLTLVSNALCPFVQRAIIVALGANVVVADYGVSMDGADPDSAVANEVVDEITAAGGNAVAVADTVTTMEGGATRHSSRK